MRYTNSLQHDLCACLKQAIADMFGVTEKFCPVFLVGQPSILTAKRCVTYGRVASRRIGMQGRLLKTDCQDKTGFVAYENWVDEVTYQINVRAKETKEDTENTPVARDIADGLVSWLMSSHGGDYLRARKIFPLKVTDIRNLISVDESDLGCNTCSFDLIFHIGQFKKMPDIDSQTGRLSILEVSQVPRLYDTPAQ